MLWLDRWRLKSKNSRVRGEAIQRAGAHRDVKAVDILIPLLDSDGEPENRAAAAAALVLIGEQRAASELIEALNDPSERVAVAAATALDSIGWAQPGNQKALVELRLGRLDNAAAEYLACPPGHADLRPLAETLRGGATATKIWAAGTLARIADRAAIALLSAAFDDPEAEVQTAAVSAVSAFSPPAFDALRSALEHRAHAVYSTAARCLGELRAPGASAVLVSALSRQEAGLRTSIAEALISIADSAAVEALTGLATGADPLLANKALAGLTKLAPPSAADPLWEIAATCATEVRPALLNALASIGDPRVVGPFLESLRAGVEQEVERHGCLGPASNVAERAREAPRRLIRIFRNQAANVAGFDLETAAEFADVPVAAPAQAAESIDYSEVRNLARAEINRRARAKRQFR